MSIIPTRVHDQVNRVDRTRSLWIGISAGVTALWSLYRVFWLFYAATALSSVGYTGISLIFPPGSVLEDEGDPVVPEPSRYSEPLPFAVARSEMDLLNHRFLYYIDAADERGRVLYLRFDGDYGLVEPA